MSASTHSPVLKHHFDNLEQQHSAERLGMWMFLVTEVLFFVGMFCAYTAYRIWFPHDFSDSNLHGEVQITDHAPNHRVLRSILLSKDRDVWLNRVKQLRDDGCDSPEVSGPRGAIEPVPAIQPPKALIPVMSWPRTSAWISCVPSYV